MPFHPSDLFALGLREDVARMFCSAPLLSADELGTWRHKFPNRMPYPTFDALPALKDGDSPLDQNRASRKPRPSGRG